MSTELNKKVLNNIALVTLAECVYMGDGTTTTVKDFLNSLQLGNTNNKYLNKTALWLGDSISVTGTPTYPKYVCDKLGMTLINKASSGGDSARMRYILQGTGGGYTTPTDLTDIDYVFIMIGHNCDNIVNENISSVPVESGSNYADYNIDFYCNVASCIEYIRNKKSTIQIYLITPIQSDNARYIKTTPVAQKVLKELGNMYSVPVIDVYGECGICRKNISLYSNDNIHPNDKGVPIIGDYIVNYLINH